MQIFSFLLVQLYFFPHSLIDPRKIIIGFCSLLSVYSNKIIYHVMSRTQGISKDGPMFSSILWPNVVRHDNHAISDFVAQSIDEHFGERNQRMIQNKEATESESKSIVECGILKSIASLTSVPRFWIIIIQKYLVHIFTAFILRKLPQYSITQLFVLHSLLNGTHTSTQ
eukprot:Gregarina_sp_Poly_1__1218@NODE_129_length_13257_cov_57_196588_g115_i0_p9_GENE_NODE_129_length_13257_cov_57_196588_g115_i0NODE_129_length_13257_cov_57_196588_g115_i0_p9_ORF_typecomplete_len169_score13_08_NODE_129_length_13257_cov_57_196588_g115_i042234729